MTTNHPLWPLAIRLFHWLTLILVVTSWALMELREDTPKGSLERDMWMSWHISVGVLVLCVTVIRLIWRSASVAPELNLVKWQQRLSRLVQAGLYFTLFALPATGLLARQLSGETIQIANSWLWPQVTAINKEVGHWFEEIHEDVLWPLLLTLVAVHAGAALLHHFYWRDDTLRSMLKQREDH